MTAAAVGQQLSSFDVANLRDRDAFVNILGRRGAGKAALVDKLLSQSNLSECPGLVMGQALRRQMNSTQLSVTEYDPYLLQVWSAKMMRASKATPSQKKPWFILLNNCMWNCTWHTDPCVRELIMHRDVFHVTAILSSNSLQQDLPDPLFACIDFTFLFKFPVHPNNPQLLIKLFRMYGSLAFDDTSAFAAAVSDLDDSHQCLVFDHRARCAHLLTIA